MTAATWGFGVNETAEMLLQVSEHARAPSNGRDYAERTAKNAAGYVERRRQQRADPASPRLDRFSGQLTTHDNRRNSQYGAIQRLTQVNSCGSMVFAANAGETPCAASRSITTAKLSSAGAARRGARCAMTRHGKSGLRSAGRSKPGAARSCGSFTPTSRRAGHGARFSAHGSTTTTLTRSTRESARACKPVSTISPRSRHGGRRLASPCACS